MMNNERVVIFEGSLKEVYIKDGSESVESWEILSGSFTEQNGVTKNNVETNGTVSYTIECLVRRLV